MFLTCIYALQIEFFALDFKSGNMSPPVGSGPEFIEFKFLTKSIICNGIKLVEKNLIQPMLYLVDFNDVTDLLVAFTVCGNATSNARIDSMYVSRFIYITSDLVASKVMNIL